MFSRPEHIARADTHGLLMCAQTVQCHFMFCSDQWLVTLCAAITDGGPLVPGKSEALVEGRALAEHEKHQAYPEAVAKARTDFTLGRVPGRRPQDRDGGVDATAVRSRRSWRGPTP
jgi:hypothetical protein